MLLQVSKFSYRLSKLKKMSKTGLVVLVIAAGGVLVLAIGKHSRVMSIAPQRFDNADVSQHPETRRPAAQPAPQGMEVEAITITARGLEPSEIHRPARPFLLRIQNHSRPAEYTFEIQRANGQKLHQLRGKKGQIRLVNVVDLPPGRYIVKELNHPEWSCSIILSAK